MSEHHLSIELLSLMLPSLPLLGFLARHLLVQCRPQRHCHCTLLRAHFLLRGLGHWRVALGALDVRSQQIELGVLLFFCGVVRELLADGVLVAGAEGVALGFFVL